MGISFVAGSMLNSDLQRDSDLAFNTNLLYIDVSGNAVGINTTTPASALEVVGNITVGNVLISNTGNISAGNVWINNLSNPVANSDAATKFYVDSTSANVLGNLAISNTTITTNLADGNITLTSTGNGITQVSGSAGFGIPVGNTSQRPSVPLVGTLRYNSSTNFLEIYDGSGWVSAAGTTSAVTNQTIEPDGGSAVYTLDQSTTAVSILVTINGISQTPGIDYTVAADQITFTTVPLSSDIVQVRFIATTTTVTEITNSSGNTSVQATDASTINFEINSALAAQITSAKIVNLASSHSLQLPAYTTANATALANVATGQVIYVSDGNAGQPCLAVYSAGAFKRIALGNTIST
jgi:hypothetical protein